MEVSLEIKKEGDLKILSGKEGGKNDINPAIEETLNKKTIYQNYKFHI